MFKNAWKVRFTFYLIAVSCILYTMHFFIFHEPKFIFRLMLNNLAFAPISVLFVTLFVNQIMEMRNRQDKIQKTYLSLGTFFQEMGSSLIRVISPLDSDLELKEQAASIDDKWKTKDFDILSMKMKKRQISLEPDIKNLKQIRDFLSNEKQHLLQMLSSPGLKEHEDLTEMLWAVYHLYMEIDARKDLDNIPETDLEHLKNDTERTYKFLCIEWTEYMKHLMDEYPYLFSFAARTNPFKKRSSIEVLSIPEKRS